MQKHFVEAVNSSGLIEPSKIKVIEYAEYDPMPHGHPSDPVFWDYELGVQFELGLTSRLESIKFLNMCLSKLINRSTKIGQFRSEELKQFHRQTHVALTAA